MMVVAAVPMLHVFAVKSSEDNVGFTDDNKKWLIPAKKTKLDLSDSEDEDDNVSHNAVYL